ncbi:MAG: hypothetical protein Q8P18_04580 [Pseudomonadota bacterium]|nr:hypothetical protein [Pseudomonadota bacterium]
MSMIWMLAAPALADRVLWTTPPDDVSAAAVARTLPGSTSAPLDSLITGGTDTLQKGALLILQSELDQVRPLASVFDGELQIMARLSKATDDVDILRTEEERNVLRQALLFEGFAVQRYFQDKLGSESAASPYRTMEGPDAWISPWLDACALLAAPTKVRPEDIPEASVRLAFDAAQAHCQAMPGATFILGELAAGAEVRIDGVKIEGGPGIRVRLMPGRHFFHVAVGDTFLLAQDARIKPGSDVLVSAPFGPSELAELKGRVASGADGWEVPIAARTPITGFGEPVYIATPAGDKTALLRVDGTVATAVKIRPSDSETRPRLVGRATLGAGWVSTGDFLLQNLEDGATQDRYTVNAGTPAASLGVAVESKWWSAGVGIDGQLTVGENHSLPTGDTDTAAFLYPHVSAGLPWAQLTIGPMFPWYLGVGARARIPIWKPVELFASGVYGVPLSRPREEGEPVFEPLPLFSAWGGVTVRVGR